MQKEMKDELERLRSQMIFKVRICAFSVSILIGLKFFIKQQELDSSMRKVPSSIRAKKIARDIPSTPLPVPPSMSAWNRGASQAQGSTRTFDETPIRAPRFAVNSRLSPSKQPRKSPEKVRNLPGFQNAFETSTPVFSPSKKPDKGKKKTETDFTMFDSEVLPNSFPSQPMVGSGNYTPRPKPQITNSQALKEDIDRIPVFMESSYSGFSQTNNADMDVAPTESDEDALTEEPETFDGVNWKAEVPCCPLHI